MDIDSDGLFSFFYFKLILNQYFIFYLKEGSFILKGGGVMQKLTADYGSGIQSTL